MMIINDLHIRVICMLIVWIYYLNVYKKYVNILTNILKNVPVAIQRCCIWKQLREKVYVLTAAQTTATG